MQGGGGGGGGELGRWNERGKQTGSENGVSEEKSLRGANLRPRETRPTCWAWPLWRSTESDSVSCHLDPLVKLTRSERQLRVKSNIVLILTTKVEKPVGLNLWSYGSWCVLWFLSFRILILTTSSLFHSFSPR